MSLAHPQQPAPRIDPGRLPRLSRGSSSGLVLGFVGIGVLVLASVGILLFFWLQFGLSLAVPIAGFLGLFPLAFVVWSLLAIDRWEPEPRVAIWFSALWGGIAAVLLTLGLNGFVLEPFFAIPALTNPFVSGPLFDALVPIFPGLAFAGTDEPAFAADPIGGALFAFYQPVIQAPFTEELWKGMPVIIMFLIARRHFDGPVDGVVIAGFSAAGFAYTENILYFGRQLVTTGDATFIFFLRGIMSPFAHAIFTAIGIGLALGIAARFSSRLWGLLFLPLGFGVSMFLHALWNSASFWVPGDLLGYIVYYVIVQVPICIGAAVLVLLLRRFESRITRVRLREYAQAGWLSAEEADRLSSSDGRSSLMRWARQRGLGRAMEAYIRITTRLAANRQRAVIGREKLRPVADEARLLGDVAALREHMAAVAGRAAPVLVGRSLAAPQPGAPVARYGSMPFAGPAVQQPQPPQPSPHQQPALGQQPRPPQPAPGHHPR